MCPGCETFAKPFDIRKPDQYRDLARKLIEALNQGGLTLLRADCSLQELLEGTWPGDVLNHDFQCAMCRRRFALHADTYHGHVEWEPGPLPPEGRSVN